MALNPSPQDKRGIVLPKSTGDFDAENCPDGCPGSGTVDITDLAVTSKGATSVTLGWTGIDEVVALERALTPGSFTEIQSGIAANSTEVTDSTVSASTEYHYRLTFASGTSNTVTVTTDASVSGDWVVYSGASNDWRSPLPNMIAVYPRPDAETQNIEYHRNYHGSLDYDVLVDVMFGRWPYRYEIITGPAGATIGNEMTRTVDSATGKILHEPGPNYGRVQWTPSGATGTQSWTVRVTDQKGSTLDVSWTSSRNDAAFVEVDSVNGNDANTGAVGDPLQTFVNGLWKNDDEDTTYAGKIAVFTGTFPIHSGTAPSAPIMDVNKKPVAFVANGSATFDTSTGNFRTTTGANHAGILFKGLGFTGSRSDLANNRIMFASHQVTRYSVHDCTFDNIDRGTADASSVDNPGIFVSFNLGGTDYHENISLVRNTLGASCNVPLITNFDCKNVSVQLFTISTSPSADHAALIKDDNENVEVRGGVINIAGTKEAISMFNQVTKGVNNNQEVCYNRIVFAGDQGVDAAIRWNAQGDTSANTFDFANSIDAENYDAYRISGGGAEGDLVQWTGNLYVGGVTDFSGKVDGTPASVQLTPSDFDADGKLTGSARTTYLGAQGAEIAGEAA